MSTSNKMNIPKTVSVGYQERQDTYTGKLAYVIYTDAKGVLRKEHSWNGWRDKKIKPNTFDNEPTSGFVLNKGVGGQRQSWGWNARNEYIRIYDPRNFEFEISVANLLFILQECTATKGKGLEGEFVYAWDKKDLVLLPVESQTYKECMAFTNYQTEKVTKKDMIVGCTYLMKDMTNVMYLGRENWYEPSDDYEGNHRIISKGKKHIFIRLGEFDSWASKYILETGFTKLAKRTSDEAVSQYADEYDKFKKSMNSMPAIDVKITKSRLNKKDLDGMHYNKAFLIKEDDKYFVIDISKLYYDSKEGKKGTFDIAKRNKVFYPHIISGKCHVPRSERYYSSYYYRSDDRAENITKEELLKKEFYTAALINEKGGQYNIIR